MNAIATETAAPNTTAADNLNQYPHYATTHPDRSAEGDWYEAAHQIELSQLSAVGTVGHGLAMTNATDKLLQAYARLARTLDGLACSHIELEKTTHAQAETITRLNEQLADAENKLRRQDELIGYWHNTYDHSVIVCTELRKQLDQAEKRTRGDTKNLAELVDQNTELRAKNARLAETLAARERERDNIAGELAAERCTTRALARAKDEQGRELAEWKVRHKYQELQNKTHAENIEAQRREIELLGRTVDSLRPADSKPRPTATSDDDAPCPVCGSLDTTGDSWTLEGFEAYQEQACNHCESSWSGRYSFAAYVSIIKADQAEANR